MDVTVVFLPLDTVVLEAAAACFNCSSVAALPTVANVSSSNVVFVSPVIVPLYTPLSSPFITTPPAWIVCPLITVVPFPYFSNLTPSGFTVTVVSMPYVSVLSALMDTLPFCSTTNLSPILNAASPASGLPLILIWFSSFSPKVILSFKETFTSWSFASTSILSSPLNVNVSPGFTAKSAFPSFPSFPSDTFQPLLTLVVKLPKSSALATSLITTFFPVATPLPLASTNVTVSSSLFTLYPSLGYAASPAVAICFSFVLKYPTFTTELSLFSTFATDMLFAVTLVTFKLSANANPVSSTVKFVSPSFNLTDILLSSSLIAIP